jgi:DNA-binding response OmpR family regulator
MLAQWGYDVTACENGSKAWSLYESNDFRLVISDWVMPETDGIELCRKIRESRRSTYCYFLLLSTKSGLDQILKDTDTQVDDYLNKPLKADELRARLNVAEQVLALHSMSENQREITPICAWCRKIRITDSEWKEAEDYVASATQFSYTYSICPSCSHKLLVRH